MAAFLLACSAGDLGKARATLSATVLQDAEAMDTAFLTACCRGHVAIARWLHDDVGGVNVHASNDKAFRFACNYGHVAVARWLYDDVGGVDAHARHDEAFLYACMNGRLDVVRWLYCRVGSAIDVHAHDDVAFRDACAHGHLPVARWLYEHVGGVNIHANANYALRTACRSKRPDVALWLDSDEVWCGTTSTTCARRAMPADCVEYVQGLRWSPLRQQWMGMVASFGAVD